VIRDVILILYFQALSLYQISMVDRSATAELATLKSVAAYWELQTRSGKYLPEESSKYVTERQLLMVQQKQIFSLDQTQIVFRVCVKPPSKLVLVQKLLGYLQKLGIESGVDLVR
jgi:hypothetical protein